MENASKALLIAGAILIVILLIAVGMLVYSKSRGVVDTGVAQMNSTEITMFNSQFTNYEGVQSSKATKTLLQTILNNNTINKENPERLIKVKMDICWINEAGRTCESQLKSTSDKSDKIISNVKYCLNWANKSKGDTDYKVIIQLGDDGIVDWINIVQSGHAKF